MADSTNTNSSSDTNASQAGSGTAVFQADAGSASRAAGSAGGSEVDVVDISQDKFYTSILAGLNARMLSNAADFDKAMNGIYLRLADGAAAIQTTLIKDLAESSKRATTNAATFDFGNDTIDEQDLAGTGIDSQAIAAAVANGIALGIQQVLATLGKQQTTPTTGA